MRTIDHWNGGLNGDVFPSRVAEFASPQMLVKETDVERINQFAFYELGSALTQIAGYTVDTPPANVIWELWQAQRQISALLENRVMQLGVSRSAALDVKNALDRIDEEYFYTKNEKGEWVRSFPGPDASPIPDWRFNYLRTTIQTFQTVFSAEMAEATAYFVPRRGIFFTPDLIDRADRSFPKETQPHIPEKAKDDWRAAGRCLAFNLLSASGFHVARAVEATLEVYYQVYTGKTGTLNGWYDYIKALEAVKTSGAKPAPTDKTLTELTQMKDDYRNPVMHPRVSLSESEARMLFDNGESLIIAMAQEIAALKNAQGATQGALTLLAGGQATT